MAIGTIRPASNVRTQFQQSVSAGAVSAMNTGVGQALSNLARTAGARFEELQAQEEADRQRLEEFSTRTQWTRLQGRFAREQLDLVNNAPVNGAGLTDARYAELSQAREQFLQTVPERLRGEYAATTEGVLQNLTTSTYQVEYQLRNDYQTQELQSIVGDLSETVYTGQTTREAAVAELYEVLEQSTLPATTQQALLEAANADLGAAEFSYLTQQAVAQGQSLPSTDGSNPVLAGLLPSERGFLNAISARESGGQYDIRYDGGAGSTFDDYSDHPRVFVDLAGGGTSSAAGRYQFTATTWDDLVSRYGRDVLPDFSPASQDRAALLLAEERYNAQRQGGRSFAELMQDGSDEELLNLKRILGGTGRRTTWQAFQTMDDQEFIELFRGERGIAGGGTGTAEIPDIWNDPRFEDLDFETKMRLAGEAQSAANSMREAAREAQQQFSHMLQAQIALGSAGEAEVLSALENGQVPLEDYDRLINLTQEERRTRVAAETFARDLAAGAPIVNNETSQQAAYRLLRDAGVVSGLQEQTPEAQNTLINTFNRSGVMPPEINNMLGSMMRSTNPQQVSYAMDALTAMRAGNPHMFAAAVPEDLRQMEGAWRVMRRYSPEGDVGAAMQALNDFRDPAQMQVRQQLTTMARDQLAEVTNEDIISEFDPGMFAREPNLPQSQATLALLRTDFEALYETMFPLLRDHNQTMEMVAEQMRYNWGEDTISGSRQLMYLAPTSSVSGYAPINGSYDWMQYDLRESLGLAEDAQVELMSDAQTEYDIRNGAQASYLIAEMDERGLMRTRLAEDGITPLRFRFSPSENVLAMTRLQNLITNREARLERIGDDAQTGVRNPMLFGVDDYLTDRVRESRDPQLQEMYRELELLRREAFSSEETFDAFPNQPALPQ